MEMKKQFHCKVKRRVTSDTQRERGGEIGGGGEGFQDSSGSGSGSCLLLLLSW